MQARGSPKRHRGNERGRHCRKSGSYTLLVWRIRSCKKRQERKDGECVGFRVWGKLAGDVVKVHATLSAWSVQELAELHTPACSHRPLVQCIETFPQCTIGLSKAVNHLARLRSGLGSPRMMSRRLMRVLIANCSSSSSGPLPLYLSNFVCSSTDGGRCASQPPTSHRRPSRLCQRRDVDKGGCRDTHKRSSTTLSTCRQTFPESRYVRSSEKHCSKSESAPRLTSVAFPCWRITQFDINELDCKRDLLDDREGRCSLLTSNRRASFARRAYA